MKKTLIALFALALPALAHADLKSVSDCSWATDEIEAAAEYVTDHWNSFESNVEADTGVNIKSCLENRFKSNGKVECETTAGACNNNGNVNGWASYLSRKVHICWDPFLDNLQSYSDDNQIACLVALMTHEFGHTCWRGHGTVEDMDGAAFDWFAGRADTNVTIDLIDCGMD